MVLSYRAALRRMGIANGTMVFPILCLALVFGDPSSIPVIGWGAFGIIVVLVMWATVDVLVVYHYVKKIQPVRQLNGAAHAYVHGTTWAKLREEAIKAKSFLERQKELLEEVAGNPRLSKNQKLKQHIKEGAFMQVFIIIKNDNQAQERAAKKEARRRREADALIRRGVEEFGISEAEMAACVERGKGQARIEVAQEAIRLRSKAEELGCGILVEPTLARGDLGRTRTTLEEAKRLLETARTLGIESGVQSQLASGDLAGAERLVREAGAAAHAREVIASYEQRIAALAPGNRHEPRQLLAELQKLKVGSRPYRKMRHKLDRLL